MFKFEKLIGLLFCILLDYSLVYSQSSACEVVNYITSYEIRSNKLTETDTVVIQINDRTGERYTDISLPYSKNDKFFDLSAWIEDSHGKIIRKLKSSDVVDKSYISDFSLYEDDFVKTFSLKHNNYPYRIVYTYKITYKQFITISWKPALYQRIPTLNARFSITVPKDYNFKKYCSNLSDPKVENKEDAVCYTWQSSYPKPIRDEVFALSLKEILPWLVIQPMNFVYGLEGSAKDWQSFGNWQFRLAQGLDELPDDEKMRVSALIKGINDKREMVRILYHYMQDHTRYVNVSIDIGGLKPYPASYVSRNKYGDCKALTNYMKALLNFVGIKSYYTVIYGGAQAPAVATQFPGPQYFNHVILTVPLDKDTIWLENTSNINPFGYIGSFTQNRKAFLIDESASRLIQIPGLSKYDVLTSRKINMAFNKFGDASVSVAASFKGADFEEFNALNAETNKTEQDEWIRKYLTYSNFDLIKWGLNKPNRDSAFIQLNLDMTFYKVMKSLGTESYISIFPMDIPRFEQPKDRKLAVKLPYPIYRIDSLTYQIPDGYEVKSVPEKVRIKTSFGEYELTFKNMGSTLEVVKRFFLEPQVCLLNQYPDFYKFISSVNEADKAKVVLKKKT